jgi:hypothetical protein
MSTRDHKYVCGGRFGLKCDNKSDEMWMIIEISIMRYEKREMEKREMRMRKSINHRNNFNLSS